MAAPFSILDALIPGWPRSMQGQTKPPIPVPNPLRQPAQPPASPGILESLLTIPSIGGLTFGLGGEGDLAKKAKDIQNEAQARQYYNADGVQIPLPERGARSAAGNAGETGGQEGDSNPFDAGSEGDAEVPLPERSPFSGGGGGGTTRDPDGNVRTPLPVSNAVVADPFKAMMLQMAASLMVPQWGGTMSQIGQAFGQGMGAAGRAGQLNDSATQRALAQADKDETRALQTRKVEADIEKTKAETQDIQSGESSRSRRLRGKQPTVLDEAAAAANLGPKGKAYLAQRIKTLNQEDLLGEENADPVEKFNQIITEAQKLDAPSAPAKAPNVGGTEQAPTMPIIKTVEDAKKLPSGTKFLFDQNGRMMIGTAP